MSPAPRDLAVATFPAVHGTGTGTLVLRFVQWFRVCLLEPYGGPELCYLPPTAGRSRLACVETCSQSFFAFLLPPEVAKALPIKLAAS